MRVEINPAYKHLEEFINKLPESFSTEGETIYKGRNELKVFDVDSFKINVKRYRVPSFFNQLIYSFLRVPKCIRAYLYAQKVIEKGFCTPAPIAYIVCKRNKLIQESYFVSIQVPFSNMLYDFGVKPLAGKEHIIRDLARYTAALHDNEIYHKDYSPGNILYCEKEDKTEFCLVDINRMSFGPVSQKMGCANFARLWGKTDLFNLLAVEYAKTRGFDIAKCQTDVLFYRNKFWKRYNKKHGVQFD